MTKYHLNKLGLPGACRAKKANCPFGGDEAHTEVGSIKEARVWAEKRIAEEYGGTFGVSNAQEKILSAAGIESFTQASEHARYKGKYYGYVAVTLTGVEEPVYIPQDLEGNLVNDTKIWQFIDEIPQEIFQDPKVNGVFRDSFEAISSWQSSERRAEPENNFTKFKNSRFDSSNPLKAQELIEATAAEGIPGWKLEGGKLVSEEKITNPGFGGKALPLVLNVETKGSVAWLNLRYQGKKVDQWTGRMEVSDGESAVKLLRDFVESKATRSHGVALGSAHDWEGSWDKL